MKADLSKPENRAAFMAMYIGQKVILADPPVYYNLTPDDFGTILTKNVPLSLRPISSLTDEECEELAKIIGYEIKYKETAIKCAKDFVMEFIENERDCFHVPGHFDPIKVLCAIDFLRSIGILIPFRGNSVEEIIESGLAKYREE